jgi:uncharacterized protein
VLIDFFLKLKSHKLPVSVKEFPRRAGEGRGDATMSPYEILQPGGSIEYIDVYAKCVWLNPEPEEIWSYRQSIGIVKELMNGRMYPTTLAGLERAMRLLAK